MDFLFGILGMFGGLTTAAADILLDLKGKGNVKKGEHKLIDSNWSDMPLWRFTLSIGLAAVGVPLYFLGFYAIKNQLAQSDEPLALAFFIVTLVGSIGGFFIHATLCYVPIIVKTLEQRHVPFDVIDETVNRVYAAIKIPFYTMFLCDVIIPSIMIIYAILSGELSLPFAFVFATPLVLMIIGWLFRLINKKAFADFPGIIMPSLGLAMIGLMAALSAL